MNRITAWLLHIIAILITVTGCLYAVMHYLMKPVDPFSVINHPLEPTMLQIHLIAAPALVFLIGMILHSHVLLKLGNGARSGKRSGVVLATLFVVMALSGYLLQVFTVTGHRLLFWIHLSSGSIWAAAYGSHQISSWRVKRAMRSQKMQAVLALTLAIAAIFAATKLLASPEPVAMRPASADPHQTLEREIQVMGTLLRVTAYGADSDTLLQNSEEVLQSVEKTDAELSPWRNDSDLNRLNRRPVTQPLTLTHSLCDLLLRVQSWRTQTGGMFDPGMGRLGEIWDIHGNFRIPAKNEIRSALARTGMRYLDLHEKTCIAIRTEDITIDPGAFGKGEALDRAAALARYPMLLDFGGQLLVAGPMSRESWKVRIANPIDRSENSGLLLNLTSGSLSTSGGSERDGYVNGRRISHHLNPHTGQPVPSFGSVTVWQPRAFDADALSTALYVMGPQKGLRWANEHRIAACFLVTKNHDFSTLKSRSFVDKFN